MGNNTSTADNSGKSSSTGLLSPDSVKSSFSTIMEHIAENYILTQNFQDLINLNDPSYCDKIILLTSELLNENLNTHEIEYMTQKTRAGVDVYEKTTSVITFANKKKLDTINNHISSLQKRRMCMGIAKFFVRISQVYSAVFMTLNPSYVYIDNYGNKQTVEFKYKGKIPPTVKLEKIYFNLCNEKIDYLTRDSSIPNAANNNKIVDNVIFVHPEFCNSGINPDGTQQTIVDKIGIKELEKLYYDVYDFDNGKFNKMTEKMRDMYNADLKTLYAAFTDEKPESMPSSIKSFSDIKVKVYKTSNACKLPNNPYNIKHHGTLGETLFAEYATHVKNMKQGIVDRQNKLVDILKQLFISVVDTETGKNTFSIHPDLTASSLEDLNKKVVEILVLQYVSCERDYLKGLKIYESIVEDKIKKLTEEQIKNLESSIKSNIDKVVF
jgi:hypothetical protein